jgi:anti-sigma B factor antagonist
VTRRDDPPLSVRCRWDGSRATVTVCGEVDFATAGALSRHLDEVIRRGPDCLILDLGPTDFIDAAGLRVLARVRHALPPQCQVILRSPSRQVRKALEISGLTALYPDEQPGPPGPAAG